LPPCRFLGIIILSALYRVFAMPIRDTIRGLPGAVIQGKYSIQRTLRKKNKILIYKM
jgi:hypothetical protein